jgi:hypothetical protein
MDLLVLMRCLTSHLLGEANESRTPGFLGEFHVELEAELSDR